MLVEPYEIIKHTIDKFEGHKYTNHVSDRGGPTKFGVTIPAYKRHFGGHVNAETIKNMTIGEAIQIYKATYFDKAKIIRLPPRLRHIVFDMGVHHGRARPIKMIQHIINNQNPVKKLKVDGGLGPNTLKAIEVYAKEHGTYILYEALISARIAFFIAIVKNDKTQKKYLKGWKARGLWFTGKRVKIKKGLPKPILVDAKAKPSHTGGKFLGKFLKRG